MIISGDARERRATWVGRLQPGLSWTLSFWSPMMWTSRSLSASRPWDEAALDSVAAMVPHVHAIPVAD